MRKETFNSKRGLKEVQLKDPNTCENYKEVGCLKDVCDCYTLVAKQETLEEIFKEAALKYAEEENSSYTNDYYGFINGAIEGVKWQKERSYSEEDMLKFAQKYAVNTLDKSHIEQFKKK